MAALPPTGSAALTSDGKPADEFKKRVSGFVNTGINQHALLAFASEARGGRLCTLSADVSVCKRNVIRTIRFNDGVKWVARLRIPSWPGSLQSRACSDKVTADMRSELATMEFLRRKTDIPIPEVYAYNLDTPNPVGCPFIIAQHVHASTAEHMSKAYPGHHEGVPPRYQHKFFKQLAGIMVKLASVRLPKIGSITRTEGSKDRFVIGPLVETGTGPYDSAVDFYRDYPRALHKKLAQEADPVSGQREVLQAFQALASTFTHQATTTCGKRPDEGFGLANYNLGLENILVDSDFNVLAVTDWSSVASMPDAALHRLPFLMGVDCLVPGLAEPHHAALERQQLAQQLAETAEMVSQLHCANSRQASRGKKTSFQFNRRAFFCKEALAHRAMVYVQLRQGRVNREWLKGLKWMLKHSDADVKHFYLLVD
ncbi:hypothetical protein HIM_07057 [Hirsutella minnesotensis 3608]|uniref:Aminoglycoside phosphotransferase domain-containing protein n=1 Tax=Hirsutella minnesotensis 3608 TaxID=1043627 RepID=A0A0F7ZI81_9HYPO|nr:hypothetical protein HIM_07057 [Hirsutella minnesotensis 3608]